jgi:sodium/potassium-transporting ATPase subunit alpha
MTCKCSTSPLPRVLTRSSSRLLTIKGAPDILIDRCTHITSDAGNVQTLDEETLRSVKDLKDRWSAEGKRVILLARKVLPAKSVMSHPSSRDFESEMMDHAKTGLVLVGLVGIVDPPRDEIPEVVKILRRAGIRIFMVSVLTSSSHMLTLPGHW